ncbi:putative histidine kinase [Helicobacter phage Pt5303G]|nr:putative histidine kinase [Helicobacter phage Pt5303G]
MIEVSEILSKVRARLNDSCTDNCMFSDSVLIGSLNQAILNITLEFRLNRQLTRQVLNAEDPFLNIHNILGIESAKFNTKELKERTNIMKDNGELELLILGDKLSVTPFKDGELELVYFSFNEVNNILESVSMPRVCLEALVYSVLVNVLEIPTNEVNYNLISNYKHLLKLAKNNLANYLNAMYSKNIHFSKVVRV